METEQYKAAVLKIHCLLRAFVMHIWSSRGLHVILACTDPRFLMYSYQDDFMWSWNPNFISIPLLFIKVKWCCLGVIGTIHWQIFFLNRRCQWKRWKCGEVWIHGIITIAWDISEKPGRFSKVLGIKNGRFSSTLERSKQGVVSGWFRCAWGRNSAFVADGELSAVYFIKIGEWHIVRCTRQSVPEVNGLHN